MRSAPRLGTLALALALALAGPARAQKAPDVRYVAPAIAEAYCLPGTGSEVYSTNVLHQGDAIEVVEEVPGGWLKIRPPADSFSWINSRFLNHVTPNQSNWVVAREGVEVPVFIGSMVKNERPKVVGARLTRGAQVRSIGPTQADEEGT